MKHRALFVAIAVLLGLLCVRLGFWQLDRRDLRRERNASVAARADLPVVELTTLRGDTAELRFRRARIEGVADYEHELVLGSRTRNGSPGVNFLTPVRVPGRDTAYLVNRGWVYSPDASTPRPGNWREQDTVAFEGYVDILGSGPAVPPAADRPRALPRATAASARARVPYPIAEVYLVAQLPADSGRADVPARLTLPPVTDEGPHLGYAIQWFLFGTIAFAGAGIALKKG